MDKKSCKGVSAQYLDSGRIVKPYCRDYEGCTYASKEQKFVEWMNVRACGYGRVIAPKSIGLRKD